MTTSPYTTKISVSSSVMKSYATWTYFHLSPILTYSMVQSPSWKANWFAASQEIPRISRNPNVHYQTHKRPPTVSILGQPNPVHLPTSHLLEIHTNIIHPSMPRSPQWSPSLRFPHQDTTHPLLLIFCLNLKRQLRILHRFNRKKRIKIEIIERKTTQR